MYALQLDSTKPWEIASRSDCSSTAALMLHHPKQGGGGEGQGQEGAPQPLIPPLAELKALRAMQQQILDATVRVDGRRDQMDPEAISRRLEQLGEMQSDLHAVGTALLQQLQQQGGGEAPIERSPGPETPEAREEPTPGGE